MPRNNQEEWNTMFTCIDTICNCFKFWENVHKSFGGRSLLYAKMPKKSTPSPHPKKSFSHLSEILNRWMKYVFSCQSKQSTCGNSVKFVSLKVTGRGKLESITLNKKSDLITQPPHDKLFRIKIISLTKLHKPW